MSLRRQHPWMLSNLSAATLFWAGALALPAYLLQDGLVLRLGQVVLFGWLAVMAGKRLQWFYFSSIIVTITLFHVIVPSGAVIAEIGSFRVTLGALRTGAFKALTIVGMVFLSLVAVRADLRLPGRVGALVGKVFWAFEQIMESRGALDLRRPFHSADAVLSSIYDRLTTMDVDVADTAGRKRTARRSSRAGLGLAITLVGLQWALLFAPA